MAMRRLLPKSMASATNPKHVGQVKALKMGGIDKRPKQLGLFPADDTDFEREWEGMPEFILEDLTSFRSILLHFRDAQAIEDFAKLTGRQITLRTKYLWFPKDEHLTTSEKRYVNET